MMFKPSHCYENVLRWAQANGERYKSIRIVHGDPVLSMRGMIGHAWIEWRGFCYEPLHDRKWPKRNFYLILRIDPKLCRRYTVEEATWGMLASRHYGPWHEIPIGVRFEETV